MEPEREPEAAGPAQPPEATAAAPSRGALPEDGCRPEGAPPEAPRAPGEPTPMERAQRILGVDPHRLADRLKLARRGKGWTRLRLSQEASVAPSTVGNLEQEKSDAPDPVVVLSLALALGFETVGELLGDAPGAAAAAAEARPGPITLEHLVESLLRAIKTVHGAARGGPGDGPLPTDETEAGADAVRRLPTPAGVNLYVPLVVLLEPRTVG